MSDKITKMIQLQNMLARMLLEMDVPESRCDIYVKSNLTWLSRNLFIRNRKNPDLPQAERIIKELLTL